MRDLNYELKQLCRRNRDGSYATQRDRERVLDQIANQLHELGYRHMGAASLKPKHVERLVERWKADGSGRRHDQEPHGRASLVGREDRQAEVVARDNEHYGIGNRQYVTNVSKARELTVGDLAKITDPYTRMSLQLQAAFGLRRGESIKIRPEWADRGDKLVLKDTWTKGGRAREIPIRNEEQRRVLDEAKRSPAGAASFRPTGPMSSSSGASSTSAGSGHPPGSRTPPPVRADALPGNHRLGGTGRRRAALEGLDASAAGDRPGGATHDQRGTRA